MRYRSSWLGILGSLLMGPALVAAEGLTLSTRTVSGLEMPESVVAGPDGRIYVTESVEFGKSGDGRISVVTKTGKRKTFASGLHDPHGLDVWKGRLFTVDNKGQVWEVDRKGNVDKLVGPGAFPQEPEFFNDLEIDSLGNIYISDSGKLDGGGGAIYKISQDGRISTVITHDEASALESPNGLLMDGLKEMLVVDYTNGGLYRLDLRSKELVQVNDGFGGGDGLIWDDRGRLYVSDYKGAKLYMLESPDGEKIELSNDSIILENRESMADIALGPEGRQLLVPDMSGGSLAFVPLPQ